MILGVARDASGKAHCSRRESPKPQGSFLVVAGS